MHCGNIAGEKARFTTEGLGLKGTKRVERPNLSVGDNLTLIPVVTHWKVFGETLSDLTQIR